MNGSLLLRLFGSLPVLFLGMSALSAQAQDITAPDVVDVPAAVGDMQTFTQQVDRTLTAVDLQPDRQPSVTIAQTQATEEEEEEITITGTVESDLTPYQPPDSNLGTRTDTPIINVPQAVQVVPKQVLEDRGVRSITEGLRNVSGVQSGRVAPDSGAFSPVIRGFQSENVLRNGLKEETARFSTDTGNIERIEVLKGPASVLFGQGDLGGSVNIVTKQPTDKPYYNFTYQVGQFGVSRPALDISSPLTPEGMAYRFNLGFNSADSFKQFESSKSTLIAPVWRLINTDETKLTAEFESLRSESSGNAPDLPADGTVVPLPGSQIKFDTNLGDPSLSRSTSNATRFGYRLEQKLGKDWALRHEFQTGQLSVDENTNYTNLGFTNQANKRRLRLGLTINPSSESNINVNQSITGKFKTGTIEHQALLGLEFLNQKSLDTIDIQVLPGLIDVFNLVPVKQNAALGRSVFSQDTEIRRNGVGLYFQNQMTIGKNLILVGGGRFDSTKQEYTDKIDPTESLTRTDQAFSPRLGVVFKPAENLSLYASYSRSFKPIIGRTKTFDAATNQLIEGDPFLPEKGSQFEVGVKGNFLRDRLTATLAYYNLVRQNVTTSGVNETFSQLQIGKQRSRGFELDVAGQLTPGWNVIATYAYADAKITEDNRFAVGNRLVNVPKHSYSLWTTYQLQKGGMKGLGLGFGLFGQGKRSGDLINSFEVPSYLRADASVFYRRDKWRVGLNFQNLFGTKYWEGVRDRNRIIPGAPFTLTGTVSIEL